MKKGKPKQKKLKKSHQQFNLNKTTEDVTEFVGNFNGFQLYNKKENNENDLTFQKNEDPIFEDWTIIRHNSKKTESRFKNLFQEILENDKKIEKEKGNKIDNEQSFSENLLPNNIIDDSDDDDNDDYYIKKSKNIIAKDNLDNNKYKKNNINLNNCNLLNNDNNIFVSSNNNLNKNIIINNNLFNSLNNEKYLSNNNRNINIINNNVEKKININRSPNLINFNNFQNNNNNIINENNNNYQILINYNANINRNNNNNFNRIYKYNIYPEQKIQELRRSTISNSNSISNITTGVSSHERTNSVFSSSSNSSGVYTNNSNKNEYYNFSSGNSSNEQSPRRSEKKFDINIDMKRIIYLEDRRTTLMIKNIPNKFNRDLILKIINQEFEEAYDLFILPTDANGYKNFGYSFINFTSTYYIPYFYFLFNDMKWPNTNSKKVCEITYSKIQGRNNLISHYPNKIIYKNDLSKKNDTQEERYKIPYKYISLFFSAYPNHTIEKCDNYFLTKIPFRY